MPRETEYIQIQNFVAEVIWTSRTKSADIRVEDRVVSVVVPYELPCNRIAEISDDKKQWVENKTVRHREVMPTSA